MGLNSEYIVRSNILSIDPFPLLGKIFSMVLHEEWQKIVVQTQEAGPEISAFLTKGSAGMQSTTRPTQVGRLVCD